LRINSSTVQRGVLEIDAGEHLPVGVAGDPGATGAVAPLWHEAAVPAAVQGAPAHTQARLRLRARGAAEELLILDAGNEVASTSIRQAAIPLHQNGGRHLRPHRPQGSRHWAECSRCRPKRRRRALSCAAPMEPIPLGKALREDLPPVQNRVAAEKRRVVRPQAAKVLSLLITRD
jgi:hypothetical protein